MLINLPIITKAELADACEWGDGWCLACGAVQRALENGHVLHECAECEERAVASAENLTLIARRVGD